MDFDAAYLNSLLKHVIYARCPPGIGGPGDILRVLRALYSLKQSGRKWYDDLRGWLRQLRFTAAAFDPCVFMTKDLVISVYVDRVLMTGTPTAISAFMATAGERFRMKDLGRPKMLLGLEFDYDDDNRRVYLHQRTYARAILRRYSIDKCNGHKTALDPNDFPPRTPSDQPVDQDRQTRFQSIVGSVNFLTIVSRPDLSYATSMLGSYNSNVEATRVTRLAGAEIYTRDHQL